MAGLSFFTTMKTDHWVRPFLRRYRMALIGAILLGLLMFFCASALMFTSGYLISRAAEMPGNIMLIYVPIILTRAFGIGRPLFRYAERLTSHNWVLKMTSGLRLKLYKALEQDAVFVHSLYRTGDILGLLSEDVGHLQNLYLRTIFPTLLGWLVSLIIVIVIGYFSWWFALVMLLLLVTIVIFVPLVSVLVNGARQLKQKQVKNELYAELTDNVLGVFDWTISNRSNDYLLHYNSSQESLRTLDNELFSAARKRNLILQALFGVAIIALLLWAGSSFGAEGSATMNWIAASVLCFFPLIDAFAPLSDAALETNAYNDSIVRLNNLPDDVDQPEECDSSISEPFRLTLKNLSFSYPGSRVILNDINLTIQPGQKLALLGRSGSGKSTLAMLIRGDLCPKHGSVCLNDVATSHFGDSISRYIGVIQQKTYLFNTTLRNNLKLGNQAASDEEVWKVLGDVGLETMVSRLPEGLDTIVDEAGLCFSGGERHRLALARVLLQDTPIIILDEPTVGLDLITEKALLETFFRNTQDKTVIMITHHLLGVSMLDRVIFLEDGSIILDGKPTDLAAENPYYQKLLAFDQGIA